MALPLSYTRVIVFLMLPCSALSLKICVETG
jgi:hypothetical protein